ncbi:MAG: hypothetical protein IH956_09965, partial [Chloroflexi bacterium]|nr:hypothetical protein [Chloroflexota bacterium]
MKTDLKQEISTPAEIGVATPPPRAGRLSSLARASIFDSLQYRDFRWVFLGSFASFMAMSMLLITQAWLVVKLS